MDTSPVKEELFEKETSKMPTAQMQILQSGLQCSYAAGQSVRQTEDIYDCEL